jgi:hypothetical protein
VVRAEGIERLNAENLLKQMEGKADKLAAEAGADARNVFFNPESYPLLRNDLARIVSELEAELEETIGSYKKLHKERGWPLPTVEYVVASCGPFCAFNEFVERHARPALARFEQICTAVSTGAPLPQGVQPEEATWVLAGCAWQDLIARPA